VAVLIAISTFFEIVPLLAGLLLIKYQSRPLKTILIYLAATLVVEVSATLLAASDLPNHALYSWFIPGEYCLLAFFFIGLFTKKVLRSVVLFSAFSAIYMSFVHPRLYATPLVVIESLLIIMWILIYFTLLFMAEQMVNLYHEPPFWISVGLLVNFTGSFVTLGLYNYILMHSSLLYFDRMVHAFLNIFMYSVFTVGILCKRENLKSASY